MSPNKVNDTLIISLLVILFLQLLSFIPEVKLEGWKFKHIDLLADVRADVQGSEVSFTQQDSTLAGQDSIPSKTDLAVADSLKKLTTNCPTNITCIEDYSGDSTALRYFIESLNQTQRDKTPLRIAFYGDSFIEGDVFCGSIRDTLQSLFGGYGVGFVPITSEVAGFRTTIRHEFSNWKTASMVIPQDRNESIELGPAGLTFIPLEDNWVQYFPSWHKKSKTFNTMKIFYKDTGHAIIHCTFNDTTNIADALEQSTSLSQWQYHGEKVTSAKFAFLNYDSLQLFGASFESPWGIYVDNFSLRGNSGIGLYDKISSSTYTEFNKFRNYKLIILEYGLNVAVEDSLNYSRYAERMTKVINKLKKAFPKTSILMMSVSDRSTNVDGEFKTMNAIPALIKAQRTAAQKTKIAFWDLYTAMGGENSMTKLVDATPPLAAKDYTHLNFKGGKKIALLFVNSLLYERDCYNKRHLKTQAMASINKIVN